MGARLPAALANVSYSRLNAFESCARQFWHGYVDRTPPDGYDRVEGWMGTRVHSVLEWALKETLGKQVPDPVEILQRYEADWDAEWGPHVLITKRGYDAEHYRRIGRQCLKDHLDKEWPFLKHTPLLIEERVAFQYPLGTTQARFMGFVDRVDEAEDGRVRIVDYKTGGWMPDFDDPASARQLALYWYALRPRFPNARRATLVWEYLQKGRTIRLDATPELVKPAVSWVRRTSTKILSTLEKDDSKEAFPASPGPLCRWCSFGYACDANPYRGESPEPRPSSVGQASLVDFE